LACAVPLAAEDSNAAVALIVQGQVSSLRDGSQQAIFAGDQVRPRQMVVTGTDGYALFRVADGSTFEVFPNAKVTFRDNYPSWTDLVQLWLGRIRVQIEHKKGPNPQRVSTPTAVISVRGTIFDVVVEDEVEETTVVSVEEGLVAVQHRLQPGREVLLNPSDSLRVLRAVPLARMVDHSPVIRKVLDAAREALYQAMTRRPGATTVGGGTTSSGGSSTSADKGGTGSGSGSSSGSGSGSGSETGPSNPPPSD